MASNFQRFLFRELEWTLSPEHGSAIASTCKSLMGAWIVPFSRSLFALEPGLTGGFRLEEVVGQGLNVQGPAAQNVPLLMSSIGKKRLEAGFYEAIPINSLSARSQSCSADPFGCPRSIQNF